MARLTSSGGKVERRPVLFDGYGHFASIQPFLERFPHYGSNIVQLEIGPRSLFPEEGKTREFEPDFTVFEREFLPRFESCRQNNQQLALLLSPHYHPPWWLEKHPDLAAGSGFLKYNIMRPEARAMVGAFIRALVGRLRETPHTEAIHSICLMNEPIFTASPKDAFHREAEAAYAKAVALFKEGKKEEGVKILNAFMDRCVAGVSSEIDRLTKEIEADLAHNPGQIYREKYLKDLKKLVEMP